jgi:hypothetical protein
MAVYSVTLRTLVVVGCWLLVVGSMQSYVHEGIFRLKKEQSSIAWALITVKMELVSANMLVVGST